ncbi:hypothetical protein NPIL_17681 [Nephila pilipes]|uniref:Uncharacterized protein n=1 Tax=Nephila pilipes TaxID=299642 RepID=A0A8X6UEM9_NEPPI|nr:hypothetical protein NPIL_17681 [Nephila pilipes]
MSAKTRGAQTGMKLEEPRSRRYYSVGCFPRNESSSQRRSGARMTGADLSHLTSAPFSTLLSGFFLSALQVGRCYERTFSLLEDRAKIFIKIKFNGEKDSFFIFMFADMI